MLRWILRGLISEPASLATSASAVAGAFALVLFFEAVFAGESKQIVAYVRDSDADVWVMQKGVTNMHMATSFVWDWKVDKIGEIEGVAKVTPILYLNTVLRAGELDWFSFIVGIEDGDRRAGPWSAVKGKSLPAPGEAIVPSVLAELTDMELGGTISIADDDFTVVGLSEDTFSMANSVAFLNISDLEDIMSTFGSYSYFLVDAESGVDAQALAARIRNEVEKVNALPADEFVANDWQLAMQMGLEIIGLMIIIGGALASLLIGFTVYSYTNRRRRELAVMKALGVRDHSIYFGVMAQAVWISSLGFLFAVALVSLTVPLAASFIPQVTLLVTGEALLRVGLIAFVVAIVASIIPARNTVRIDPVSAFAN